MSKGEQKVLTTEQAMRRLNMSRGTFYNRLKEHPHIQAANYNPNLRKQHNATWRLEDVDQLGTPIDTSDSDDDHAA